MQENMNILDMIYERCHDGVEFRKIENICKITRGKVISKKTLRDTKNEKYPVYSSQTENNGELGRLATYDYDGEYLTWTIDGAKAGTVFYRHGKFNITNVCGLLEMTNENVNIHFLYHVLKRIAPDYVNKGMGNPKLISNVMSNIEIPVPPLDIQREIANILDQFEELEKELEKELKMRIDQYEYYRNMLLSFDDSVEMKKLGEVCNFNRGKPISAKTAMKGNIPVISGGQKPAYYHNKPNRKENCITVAGSGAYAGYVQFWNVPIYCGDAFTVEPIENINIKYLYYFLKSKQDAIYDKKVGAGIPHVHGKDIKNFKIPIPSLEVQKSIAETLDQFDELCTSLTNGIPAEIAMRKEQYEYYRNILLNSKNINE